MPCPSVHAGGRRSSTLHPARRRGAGKRLCNFAVATAVLTFFCLPHSAAAESIAEFIAGKSELNTFAAHLNRTGAMKRLQDDPGPFTVFAPADAAFEKWGPGEHRALENRPARVGDLVRYHIVVGQPVRTLVVPQGEPVGLTTLAGLKLLAEAHLPRGQTSTTVTLNGQANVTEANLGPFSNGFVHVINGVLSYPGWLPDGDLSGVLQRQQNHLSLSIFAQLVAQDPDILTLAAGGPPGPFTVFAPTDKALLKAGLCTKPKKGSGISTLTPVKLSRVLPKDRELVKRVLRFHVVQGRLLTAADLEKGGKSHTLDTGSGDAAMLSYQRVSGGIDLNLGGGKLDEKRHDFLASNGVLHVVDSVLLPPGLELPDMVKSREEYKRQIHQLSETPVPPEPSPIDLLDFSDGASKLTVERVILTERQHTLVMLAALAFVVLIFWGLHRLTAGRENADEGDAEVPGKKRGKGPKSTPPFIHTFLCVMSVIGIIVIPMFSSTDWMLPDGMRTVARSVRSSVISALKRGRKDGGAAVSTQRVSEQESYTAAEEAAEKGRQDLLEALGAFNSSVTGEMREKLLRYGIDRLELLARADHADRERLRFPDPAAWDNIVAEARRRTGWEPETTPAPTPIPRARTPGSGKQSPDLMQQWNQLIAGIQQKNAATTTSSKPDFGMLFPPKTSKSSTPPPVVTPPPTFERPSTPPPTPADPDAGKPKLIVGLVSVPFSGDESIECTIGHRHGKFEPRDDTITERVHLVARGTMKEVDSAARPGSVKAAAKSAKLITTTLLRDPLNRAALAFQAAIGKSNDQTKFRCKGKLARVLSQPGYSLDEYSRLSPQVRALCESARNVQVKALADHPLDMPATQETLDHAKQVLAKRLTTFLLHENMDKSMYMLRRELGDAYLDYVTCTPIKNESPSISQRATQVLSEENKLDLELFDHARHLWFTTWAGKYEDNFQDPSCESTPRVCFDENDKNGEKKMKVPYDKVHILMRGSTPKSIVCASKCTAKKS
eukprot:Hpha_TRINITY_DN14638_c1_g6::TRINITY_DN14638_c1_g6_i1::g.48554::m.48554